MDLVSKLNMTFLVFSFLSVLFIKIRSEMSGEVLFITRLIVVSTTLSSFSGFIITTLVRIWQ